MTDLVERFRALQARLPEAAAPTVAHLLVVEELGIIRSAAWEQVNILKAINHHLQRITEPVQSVQRSERETELASELLRYTQDERARIEAQGRVMGEPAHCESCGVAEGYIHRPDCDTLTDPENARVDGTEVVSVATRDVIDAVDRLGLCAHCGVTPEVTHDTTCLLYGLYPVNYITEEAPHQFVGDDGGDFCKGCGEHRNWHPAPLRVVPSPGQRLKGAQ